MKQKKRIGRAPHPTPPQALPPGKLQFKQFGGQVGGGWGLPKTVRSE